MSQLTEKSEGGETTPNNNRLVSLKVLVFLFAGALVNMYAFLPAHMQQLGFTLHDIRLVTLISALVSIIGPILVGFFLDRIAVKRPSGYGKWLRVLLFVFFILAGLAFGALLLVPAMFTPARISSDPSVTFSCNDNHAHVFIKKNKTSEMCQNLEGLTGDLKVFNCRYACKTSDNFKVLYEQLESSKVIPERFRDLASLQSGENSASVDYDYDENLPEPASLVAAPTQKPLIQPPHVCVVNSTLQINCFVYLDGNVVKLPQRVGGKNGENDTLNFGDEYCIHPLESTSCQIPDMQIVWMNTVNLHRNQTCTVTTECMIEDPFSGDSLLRFINRDDVEPEVSLQFDLYLLLRIIAEYFPVIIHMLLNVAIIIATRETSTGRGDVGHIWVFYPIGVLIFATVIGLINHAIDIEQHIVPILVFSVTMFVCAVVVLFSGKLPLTPSDWYWHTKCGMLAIPMSALKRYKWVIFAITLVALTLGSLWHAIEPIRHIFSKDILEYEIVGDGQWRSKTFVYIIGSLLAIPLIWNGEIAVDLIGHSNIFILAFVSLALRFVGLYFDCKSYVTSAFELLEPMNFYVPLLCLILFTRHLIPKKFLAVGQGLFVVLFFSLGRGLGFFFGTSVIADDRENAYIWEKPSENVQAEENDFQTIHTVAASIACVAALLYFTIYHLILIPYYRVSNNQLAKNNNDERVFHDERSRKGYFRY